MDDDPGHSKEKLWLDDEFRCHYPLTAQRLNEAALQEQLDLGYRRYTEVLQRVRAAAELSHKELIEFSMKEDALKLISESNVEREEVSRPSPKENCRSFRTPGKLQDLKD
jgi:hypothetical protein